MAGQKVIELSMDTAEAKKGLTELIKLTQETADKFEEVNKKLEDKGSLEEYVKTLSKNLDSTNKKITETTKKLAELKKKREETLKAFNEENAPKVKELNASSEKSKKKIDNAMYEIEESKYDLTSRDKNIRESAQKRIDNLQGVINTETQNIDNNNAEIAKLKSQAEEILNDEKIKKLEEELVQLHAKKEQIIDETNKKYDGETQALLEQRDTLKQNLDMMEGGIQNSVAEVNKLENPFNKIKAHVQDFMSEFKGKAGTSLFGKNPTAGLQKGMTSILGTTKKFAMALLGARTAYTLIYKAVNQIKEENKELANTMSTLWNGVISLITPAVNALVNAFATALNYAIKLISTITGVNVIKKLQQANKKANSKSGSGSSGNKLYSFDTSETLQKNGSGSSVDEGLIKNVELNEKLLGYAEKLKTIWDNIAKTGENLVARIKEGWNYMDAGKRIMQVLDNLLNAFLDDMILITQATKEWSETINFGPLFDSIANVMESLEPILEKIGDLCVWIWKETILPLGSYLIEQLFPAINNALAPGLALIDKALEKMQELLGPLWGNVIKPLISAIGEGFIDILNSLQTTLEAMGENEKVVQMVTALGIALGILVVALIAVNAPIATIIAGVSLLAYGIQWLIDNWDLLKESTTEVWESIKTTITEAWENIKKSFSDAWENIKKGWNTFKSSIKESVNNVIESIKNSIQNVKEGLSDLISYIVGTFVSAWSSAWEGIKSIFTSIWNSMLGVVESVVNGIISAINWVIRAINKLSFDIPDWGIFGEYAGKTFGFDISEISKISLPRLAQGAVIPPNKEFLALLGDQTRGKNIEAPEELIREIVSEEAGTQEINIVANGTMSQLIKLLRLELQKEDKRVGTSLVVGG